MTFARFLVLWATTSFVVALLVGRAIALGRLAGKPRHLLTARQAAAEVGVSLAAVKAWQRDGLLSTAYCPACGRASISPDALRPLVDRDVVDLTAGVPAEARS